jgi:predicted benzoate:H+ symporter BenE
LVQEVEVQNLPQGVQVVVVGEAHPLVVVVAAAAAVGVGVHFLPLEKV